MKSKASSFETIFSISVIAILTSLTLIFFYLYMACAVGFVANHSRVFYVSVTISISAIAILSIVSLFIGKNFIYRLCMMLLLFSSIIAIFVYGLNVSGFWDRVDSVEDMREFIASTGSYAVFAFIAMQILQVVILPIPGIIAIGAGVALFGAFWGALYSFVGIMIGSLFSFWVGRVLGYKAAKWLVGDGLDKTLNAVKGKDKIILTFMFIFPFFPDDILCFVAGMSSMTNKYYLIMITLTRLFSVYFASFSVSGNLIPYNTWWGIMIWSIIFVLTIFLTIYIYKHGEELETKISTWFQRKKKK